MNGRLRTLPHEHKHTYAPWTQAHVHNMNTSTRTQHERWNFYHPGHVPNPTTWTQAHVHSINTSTGTQQEHKHAYSTWTQARVHNMNTSKQLCYHLSRMTKVPALIFRRGEATVWSVTTSKMVNWFNRTAIRYGDLQKWRFLSLI